MKKILFLAMFFCGLYGGLVWAEEAAAPTSGVSQQEHVHVGGNQLYNSDAPNGYEMLSDLLIARPLLIGLTAIGTVAFVVSLPFTLLGDNVGEAAESLVVAPGREAFVRCLGCSSAKS